MTLLILTAVLFIIALLTQAPIAYSLLLSVIVSMLVTPHHAGDDRTDPHHRERFVPDRGDASSSSWPA